MFADDTKKCTTVKTIADSQRLRADLNSLARWADDWLLRFNVKKCKCMCQLDLEPPPHNYNLTDASKNQHNLTTKDCEKDLEIRLSPTLRPSVQCQKAYSKAMQSLATIKQEYYIGLIQYFIQNIYSTTHWILYPSMESILLKRYWSILEKIQHWATKLVLHLSNLYTLQRMDPDSLFPLLQKATWWSYWDFQNFKTIFKHWFYKVFTLSTSNLRGHD